MPESQSTGNSKLSGVEGGAPPERTTAQSGRSSRVAIDGHERLHEATPATQAGQDFAIHRSRTENQTPQRQSRSFWGAWSRSGR